VNIFAEGFVLFFSSIVAQVVITAFSAVTGAVALLLAQTQYNRVKLLRSIEQEIEMNLKTVGKCGYRLEDSSNHQAIIGSVRFNDEVYRTIQSSDPILFTEISRGIPSISELHQVMMRYSNMEEGKIKRDTETREYSLKEFKKLEYKLGQFHLRIQDLQENSWMYRQYNRFFLNEPLNSPPPRYSVVESGDCGIEKKDWGSDIDLEPVENPFRERDFEDEST
jgi:hypothetical protein